MRAFRFNGTCGISHYYLTKLDKRYVQRLPEGLCRPLQFPLPGMLGFAAGRITALAAFLFEVPHVQLRFRAHYYRLDSGGCADRQRHLRARAAGRALVVDDCQTGAARLDYLT